MELPSDEPLTKICSVWLCFDNADYSRIRFWSQILQCQEFKLKQLIENVKYLNNNKRGIKTEDAFLILMHKEMKDLSIEGMKRIFNEMRNKTGEIK